MTRFVGIDPAGLVGLADTADQYAQRIRLTRSNTAAQISVRPDDAPDIVNRRLAGVEHDLVESSKNLRWRADAIERSQAVGLAGMAPMSSGGWLARFAASAVFSLDSWETTFSAWRSGEYLRQLSEAEPAAVAEALAAMDDSALLVMARTHPNLVGGLDGAPPEMRYAANRVLISYEIMRLEATLAAHGDRPFIQSPSRLIVGEAEARLAEYRRWLTEGRQILLFDPEGDGRVVEVFGALEAADAIAVVIPGMSNDLANFSTVDGGFRLNAASLFAATSGKGVATVAWLGYDTPDGADAVSRSAAETGAPDLARFLSGIDPIADHSVTVVAHSYGSVLTGIAAADGIEADNVVFVGSPGTTLDHAADAILRPGGIVWAALADGDPIGLGVDPLESYRWWWGIHPLIPAVGLLESLRRREDLWHGTNPASAEFGARRMTTEGSSGHSAYFEAGSLDNLAAIVEGRHSSVDRAD
ncbi:MAG: hypothetical protein GY722_03655 [bacterium]|nr:hypothetical protein [bacterium]